MNIKTGEPAPEPRPTMEVARKALGALYRFLRWFVTNSTPAVIMSALALTVAGLQFYFANYWQASRLQAVVSSFNIKIYDVRSEDTYEDSFAFASQISLALTNSGNRPSALLTVRAKLIQQKDDCKKYEWYDDTGRTSLGGYLVPPFSLAQMQVEPNSIVLKNAATKLEDRSLRAPKDKRVFVCLQFRSVDYRGKLHENFVIMASANVSKGGSTTQLQTIVELIAD